MFSKIFAQIPLLATLVGAFQADILPDKLNPSALLRGEEPAPAVPPPARAFQPDSLAQVLEIDPCGGFDHECGDIRRVYLNRGDPALQAGGAIPGGVVLHYDYDEVTRSLRYADLAGESELSLAVRLIVSEVGADRLLVNEHGLMEAIGILYTVDNRLDPLVYNPLNLSYAPTFPGCGPDGTFAACANAQQYLGMGTWRALEPTAHYRPDMLERAVDVAVMAWYLQEERLVADPTEGATNYVHRCGGEAYGMPTYHCDGHIGRPAQDIPGANPHTGPTVFSSPTSFLHNKGHYRYEISQFIDYERSYESLLEDAREDVREVEATYADAAELDDDASKYQPFPWDAPELIEAPM